MAPRRASSLVTAALVVVVALLAAWWQARDAAAPPSGPPRAAPTEAPRAPTEAPRAPTEAPRPAPPPPAPTEAAPAPARLDLAAIGDPDERAAIVVVATAIDRGGPFAYRKDGAVFENREGRLPKQPRGYWREYTVPTPDEDDRGARRLVAGQRHELRYTRDHYRSFVVIRGPSP